jgi:hypothetical protein
MKKYKLIKEYPGSPELGEIAWPYTNNRGRVVHYTVRHPEKVCDILAIGKTVVEYFSEYWEEVKDIYYMVSLTDMPFHNAWEPIRVETMPFDTDSKKYFETKEQAEEFILYNKPCLSYKDISFISRFNVKSKGDVLLLEFSPSKLIELVKEKL